MNYDREKFRMKIAFLVVKNISRGGGIEKYTLELGRRLVARGHQVSVYSMPDYGEVGRELLGMRLIPVRCLRHTALEKLSAAASAAAHICGNGPAYDVIHCHSVAAGAFAPLLRLRGYRCILQMHGIEWQRSRWNFLGRTILKILGWISLIGCNASTAVSRSQCDFFRAKYGVTNMRYISTGAEVVPCRPAEEILQWGLEPGRYVLFASRLVSEKGAQYLIAAFRQIQTDFKLVIAGDAKGEKAFKQQLRDLAGDDPRILFVGFVEGKPLVELFSNAAVYVQPSEIEGLSIALLEAMSYGNCCLASDIPENIEALDGTGFLFRNRDPADLREKLAMLIASEQLRHSTAEKARLRVNAHYNWDKITGDLEEMYWDVLNQASNGDRVNLPQPYGVE